MQSTELRSQSFLLVPILTLRVPAGFTLFEILIVTFLLGVMAMLGWPTLNSALADSRLSGASSDVITSLEFAQLKAMNSGRQTRVTIDAGAETILVEQFASSADFSQSEVAEADVEDGVFAPVGNPLNRGVDYNINLSNQALFGGVDVTAVDFGGGNSVTYDTLGAPSSGGTVTLTFGTRQVVVTLDSLTGKVTVSN